MAGLEVLFTCVADKIRCPQDAVVCFVHWEMIKDGYRCIGSGDEVRKRNASANLITSLVLRLQIKTSLSLSVYKDADSLAQKVRTRLLPSQEKQTAGPERKNRREEDEESQRRRESDSDPLRMPSRHPRQGVQPHWPDPLAPPFAVGGADLDPFGSRGGGGMIVDPLRSGYPRSGFDPSSGIPDILPPGAVPPGARFDPFGPVGRHRPG
uniref:Proteasome inhibitor PI31 subunit n=1 Tax=Cyprinodon variegatus TaxID=28743 RepID=A0A3Q2CC21_CYPVA